MSRHVPTSLRHKHREVRSNVITHGVSVMILRTGAILIWLGCVGLAAHSVFDLARISSLGAGAWLWSPVATLAGCAAAAVVGWRVWLLKRWACIAALIGAWVFCLGVPWLPSNYPGGIVDPSAAIAASVMLILAVAGPFTIAWWLERMKSGPGPY